ncbi:MAG: hypothetical protein B7Y07_12090 [Halothiobacillus sp. 24-54-40]|jgi:outer membrane lipoprotein-sorting protein|nr:hypothetical protein [Halothiobacillaceae bacterium]OYV46485.1 MAG: hypothetical protein B7X12_04980 [Halothiobacillus sp. 20-53-49]OYY30680.1 MAG: hypothetical protein B7Y58_11925 [Halothiobacillus sp. 35-54-62]OYZ84932.1 MAG: hypothetical protein B7Y07_12090 [Halothiobacillus sp. 24-54-40]OZA78787.1 MAG: hypothetical protein B7X64_12195 [Halothiobacillus sp. 39-53-45]HQS03573.1 hypothetical protein [Halothiobacillus sp.]
MNILLFFRTIFAVAALALAAVSLAGCGAGGTATQAAAEAQAAKAAKQDLDSVKSQLDAAQNLQSQQLKQAEQP